MGLFSKKRAPKAPPPTSPEPEPATAEAPGIGPGDETLAGVIRVFGEKAIEVDDPAQEDFGARCEAWAQHLLAGAPAPVGAELPGRREKRASGKRAYADLRQFFAQRRTLEQTFLTSSLGELKGALVDLVMRLRKTAADAQGDDVELGHELAHLSEACETQSLAQLKSDVKQSMAVLAAQLERRETRRKSELHALGRELSQLRTDLHKAEDKARTDPLTGLDNRVVLDEGLSRYVTLAEAAGEPLTAVLIDLDHFKRVNDTHGHQAGDAVLKAAGAALVRCYLRKCDLVCRYGGEEFCVLLPSTSAQDAARLTQRLLDQFRRTVVAHEGDQIRFTGSAGVATLADGEDGDSLLRRADQALYAAKDQGRDRVIVG